MEPVWDLDVRMNQTLSCRWRPGRDGVADGGIVPMGLVAKVEDCSLHRSRGAGSRGVRVKSHRHVAQPNL